MIHNLPAGPALPFLAQVSGAAPSIRGKYAHVRTSSDAFMKRKRAELELEE